MIHCKRCLLLDDNILICLNHTTLTLLRFKIDSYITFLPTLDEKPFDRRMAEPVGGYFYINAGLGPEG